MDSNKKPGRPAISDSVMTPAELQKRHRMKMRDQGKKIIQVTIDSPELMEALSRVRLEKGLSSDTATANFVLNASLSNYLKQE